MIKLIKTDKPCAICREYYGKNTRPLLYAFFFSNRGSVHVKQIHTCVALPSPRDCPIFMYCIFNLNLSRRQSTLEPKQLTFILKVVSVCSALLMSPDE